jgi:hypothetical protein
MNFNEADREIFEGKINEYIKQYGEDALKGVFRLSRDLDRSLPPMKNLPILEIFRYLLFLDFKEGKFNGLTLKEIAIKEGVGQRTIYNYFAYFYKKIGKKFNAAGTVNYYHTYLKKKPQPG